MNAHNHSKFNVLLTDLIKADLDYVDACIEAGGADIEHAGEAAHDLIMSTRCNNLAEVRAKLQWMTEGGTGLRGEDEGYRLLLADLDRLIAKEPHGPHNQAD